MIQLGLSRILRLVQPSNLKWKAVHIAGTNGKGSIASYVSAMLRAAGVRCGTFTSPHLMDRWDCISMDERVVDEREFLGVEGYVKRRGERLGIGASQFEILTATAFEVFQRAKVEVGVVEVGMGGRLDATNVLTAEQVLASVISKIGRDHQGFLGDSLTAIAQEKAGIMKHNRPCIYDATNADEAVGVLQKHALQAGALPVPVLPETMASSLPRLEQLFRDLELEPHQKANLSCAVAAVQRTVAQIRPDGVDVTPLLSHVPACPRPGRLHFVDLSLLLPGLRSPILLDGAHNPQSALVLSRFANKNFGQNPIVWLFATSHGKAVTELLDILLRPGDSIAAVEFQPVPSMPWVESTKATEIVTAAQAVCPGLKETQAFGSDILAALGWAAGRQPQSSQENAVVVAGSLYLVSDILRMLRSADRHGQQARIA